LSQNFSTYSYLKYISVNYSHKSKEFFNLARAKYLSSYTSKVKAYKVAIK